MKMEYMKIYLEAKALVNINYLIFIQYQILKETGLKQKLI